MMRVARTMKGIETEPQSILAARPPQGRSVCADLPFAPSTFEASHQPQDREGPGLDDPAVPPASGGSGDRVIMSEGLTLAG